MAESGPASGVFALPPGVDFPRGLVAGLMARYADAPPQALARVHLIVNTRRMARRIRDLFDAGPALLLPRISLLTEVEPDLDLPAIPPAIPKLRRRLQLTQLIASLLDRQPDLAPRDALFDLAVSLADLLDEMHGEGIDPATIAALDVSDLSGHWARSQSFIAIAQQFFDADETELAPDARQRRVAEVLAQAWTDRPPAHPVILAGSTGSRGATQVMMQAIARLPYGALVLPGFDFDQPAQIWSSLDDALAAEDHPQFRFRKLMHLLDIGPGDIRPWHPTPAPSPDRNRLVSLALRPAPVTDAWLREGPELGDVTAATADITLVEAPTPRDEALAIALRLRAAAETGEVAALITPDRMLTRQVAAALDRWNIVPDDSAGTPLHLSPPGRFLRHISELFGNRLTGESLLTLLKHPLCHDGDGRGGHLRLTRDLELHLRRKGPAFPDRAALTAWAAEQRNPDAPAWAEWVSDCLTVRVVKGERSLSHWLADLRATAERLSAGRSAEAGGLWDRQSGRSANAALCALGDEAHHAGEMNARDFGDLLASVLKQEEVRDRDQGHPHIMIWGTLEARVQGADLLILGGLNDGTWPEAARPDPWLNRSLRDRAGLLLPERRIGLAAHDFQQAIAAPQVWMTRSVRSEDAETVASRWVNRLTNLLGGLKENGGPDALTAMRARGRVWLDRARALEAAPSLPSAPRPSPRPPAEARPRTMSVTEISKLIRDPYAVYARRVLRLRALDPLVQGPDALLRGIVLHGVLEEFVRLAVGDPARMTRAELMRIAAERIETEVPWPTARLLWIARTRRIADWFVDTETQRLARAQPIAFERRMSMAIADLGFTLTGAADRIDCDAAGHLHIYDYKTGSVPSKKAQAAFDKQLLLEAVAAEEGAFSEIPVAPVASAIYIGLGSSPQEVAAPLDTEPVGRIRAELRDLIAAYLAEDQGFTARRRMQKETDAGEYDQLARFGEWDETDEPSPEDLA